MPLFKKRNGEKKERKPFRETKAFEIAKKYLPHVVEGLADIIPGGKMISGIIKTIKGDDAAAAAITPAELATLHEYESEMYKLEVADRESARNRELEVVKAGGKNYTQNILAFTGVIGFFVCLFILIFGPPLDDTKRDALLILLGTMGSFATAIFAYYFGSSKSSADKNHTINTMMSNEQ